MLPPAKSPLLIDMPTLDKIIAFAAILLGSAAAGWICQMILKLWSRRSNGRVMQSQWHKILLKHKLAKTALLIVPGIIFYHLTSIVFETGSTAIIIFRKIDIVYMVIISIMTSNAALASFFDISTKTGHYRNIPLKGLVQGMQVILFFIGAIIIVSVLLDKSPVTLLTGLGASAAILMLIFKDSILGLVAGIQLSQNNMIHLGDWVQMPDGSANGTVEEITLNTVKVRNWDNTISMIPPYNLVTSPFKNWRGMQESGGRQVDKRIYLDVESLKICSDEFIAELKQKFPIIADYNATFPTNSQIYRTYIGRYLTQHPLVAKNLDLIIAQREQTELGLPIEVYFFLTDKVWNEFETIQSDIFDHLLAMAPVFGLKLSKFNI